MNNQSIFLNPILTKGPQPKSVKTRALQRTIFILFLLCTLFKVQATVRYVKPGGSGNQNGLSWANASGDIMAMILASSSGDEIWVAAGTYTPTTGTDRAATFSLKNGVEVYGGFNGTETSWSQRDYTTNVTILSGEIGSPGLIDNSYHVVFSLGANLSAKLDGFTITAGNATTSGNQYNQFYGGGMYNWSGSPLIANCIFTDNWANTGGGAMANYEASPFIVNCIFSGNIAYDNNSRGGGMSNQEGSNPVLTNCAFIGNRAESGGGMYNSGTSSPTLNNCTFSGNEVTASPKRGGAMYSIGCPSCNPPEIPSPTLKNCIIWGNDGSQIYHTNVNISSTSISYSIIEGGCSASYCNNILDVDPLFVSQPPIGFGSSGDLHLQDCSPAIDAGTSAGAPGADFEGDPRPQGLGVDMGFDESLVDFSITTRTWTGEEDTDWYNACNWSPPAVPTASNDVVIPNMTNDPSIPGNTSAVAKSLTLQTGSKLTVNDGTSLTVNESVILHGHLLIQFGGSVSGNRLTLESGAILTNYGSIASTTYPIWNKSGAMMQGNGQYFSASNWVNQGTFSAGTSHVTFNGVNGGTIDGTGSISFYDLEMLNGNATTLGIPATVEHEMIMTAGNLNLNGFTLTLNGAIINESETSHISGNGTITKTLTLNAPSAVNPGNMGVTITSAANLGLTTIQRGHVVQDVNGEASILRYYDITPTNNTGLNATVRFHYFDFELNGIPESDLTPFRFNGISWDNYPVSATNMSANWVETQNVDVFSRWTLANCIPTNFYADTDGDGYGDPAVSVFVCSAPSGYVADNTDCNDTDPNEFPGQIWYKDFDDDGYPGNGIMAACERPAGHKLASELISLSPIDCDDSDPAVHMSQTWYLDEDNDNYTSGATVAACHRPSGYKLASELVNTTDIDCNDSDANVNPNPDCSSTTRTWTGHISTDWDEACNWSPNCVPTANDDVIIPDVTNDPVISGAAVTKSVSVNFNGLLTIQSGASLDIDNAASSGLQLNKDASLINYGVINIGATAIGGDGLLLKDDAQVNNDGGTINIVNTTSRGIKLEVESNFNNKNGGQVWIGQSGGYIGGNGIQMSESNGFNNNLTMLD